MMTLYNYSLYATNSILGNFLTGDLSKSNVDCTTVIEHKVVPLPHDERVWHHLSLFLSSQGRRRGLCQHPSLSAPNLTSGWTGRRR